MHFFIQRKIELPKNLLVTNYKLLYDEHEWTFDFLFSKYSVMLVLATVVS